MSDELDEYLQEGSPFLREIDLMLLNDMIRDLFLEQGYYIGQAIAKVLPLGELPSLLGVLREKNSKYKYTTQENMQKDLWEYLNGFRRPFSLLLLAYGGLRTGLDGARDMNAWLSSSVSNLERNFEDSYLPFALTLLKGDLTGVILINQLIQKELKVATNLYYKLGLEAARRSFLAYTEILDTLIPNTDHEEDKDPTSLLERLSEYEKTAPSPQQLQPINPILKQMEEILVESVKEKPSYKTVFHECLFFFKILFRKPHYIRALFFLLLHSIRVLHKNPGVTMQRMKRIEDVNLRIQEMSLRTQQPGEVFARMYPEMTELVESTFPYPPYPAKTFVQDIQRIRTLSSSVETKETIASQLREWERLAEQRSLLKYPALWTAICIALGDFALQKQLLGGAKRAYAKPLKRSTLWRSDLGTRFFCATRLGELYCGHGGDLKMPTLQLASAIHDVYLDMLRVNERLYQRSPYQFSKIKLQARNDFILARLLEACKYLSRYSKEAESVQWCREAFVISESGKSRMLREEMALAERLPPTEIPAQLCEIEKRCLARLRTIYAKIASQRPRRVQDFLKESHADEESDGERNKLRLDLEQAWAEMEDHGDEARAYVVARRDEALQWEGLQWNSFQRVAERLGKNFALVSMSMLPEAVLFSVLRSGWKAPKICSVDLSQNDLKSSLESYKEEILNRGNIPEQGKCFLKHEWQRLGDKLFAELVPLLDSVKYVYFLPHGVFHNLPLHALTIRGEPFIKRWGVAYAPSVSVLESTLSRPASQGPVLVMGYADPENPLDTAREFMLEEAKKIAAFFQSSHVLPEDVDAPLLRKESPSARLIHLACHGVFTEEDPLNSGVVLTDGTFTARDWLQLRLQADLVTLSACRVGISKIRPGDDLVGLTRSILFAGASSLLMTLWSVNSEKTYDWMLLFYKNLLQNDNPARKIDAVRNATLALQEENKDPYYWAPFVLIGHH